MWAHSANVDGKRHALEDHLLGTARLARGFGEAFGAGDICYGAGLAHDCGKSTDEWQRYLLLRESGVRTSSVDHKTVGAWLFGRVAKAPGLLALLGHHSGIPDNARGMDRPSLSDCQRVADQVGSAVPEFAELINGASVVPAVWGAEPEALEMRIRMLHSSLVDADYLDTAAHFNAEPVQLSPPADFSLLTERFLNKRGRLLRDRAISPIDALRGEVFDQCLEAALGAPGIYTLPGPTGSGKTISSAAFALAHAARHGKSRVVVAVPFLTITSQNAAVYRRLLGEENVIEQHSSLEPERRAKYGVDNWDAPFIVTTTVQLFESLMSNKPSKARKLHRLINSVIILDEVQSIPVRVLPVILDVLKLLVRYFGTTVLLASATQPAWDVLKAWRDDPAIEVRGVIKDPSRLYRDLRRTSTSWISVGSKATLARMITEEPRSLVIVNTTGDARDLARLLTEDGSRKVLHLSTRMFAEHRRRVLKEVHELATASIPFTLVSTQLVEAGVDLDFPVVFRALAPAENLLQAAGRCNREGLLEKGRLIVVTCDELGDLPAYRTGIQKTQQHFGDGRQELDDPSAMRRYFSDLYTTARLDANPDAAKINKNRQRLQFDTVAKEFRMIDDDSVSVVIADAPGADEALQQLSARITRGGTIQPKDFRVLQAFSVNLPTSLITKAGLVEELPKVFVSRGCYDWLTGIDVGTGTPRDSIW